MKTILGIEKCANFEHYSMGEGNNFITLSVIGNLTFDIVRLGIGDSDLVWEK